MTQTQEMSIYNMRPFAWMLWQSGHFFFFLLQKAEKTFFSWYHKVKICVCFGMLEMHVCVWVCISLCVCRYGYVWVSFLRDVDVKWSLEFREEVVCFCSWNLKVTRLLVRIFLACLWAPKTVTSMELCELFLCAWWDTHFGFLLPLYCI